MGGSRPRQYLVTESDPRVPSGARLMWVWIEYQPTSLATQDPRDPPIGYTPVEVAAPALYQEVDPNDGGDIPT